MLKPFAKLILSIAFLTLLLERVDLQATLHRIGQLRIAALPALAGLVVVQFVLSAWRWQYILRRMGASEPGLGPLLYAIGNGYFYGQLLPSSIGVDVLRTAIVTRFAGLRAATASVVIDRLYGLFVLAAWAAAALPVVAGKFGVRWPAVLLIEGMFAIGSLITARLCAGLHGKGLVGFLPSSLCGLSAETANFLRSPAAACILVLTSAAMHLATMGQFYVIAWSLGLPLGFGDCILLLPTAFLLAALPISFSGWGVREGAVVAALAIVGISTGDAVTASVLFGLITPALGLATVMFGIVGEWLTPFARKQVFESRTEVPHD